MKRALLILIVIATVVVTWNVSASRALTCQPRRYVATLTQSGTDAPTAIVLLNTLGGAVVWTRDEAGRYTGTLNGAFPAGRTVPLMPVTADPLNSDMRTLIRNSDNEVQIVTNFADGNLNGDIGDGVDITVYPEP